jgi:1,4-alpha-glucan branching enzyme
VQASVVSFLRRSRAATGRRRCNFTPVTRPNYAIGVPQGGFWREL